MLSASATNSHPSSSKASALIDDIFGTSSPPQPLPQEAPAGPNRKDTPSVYDSKLIAHVMSTAFLPEHAAAQASALPLDAGTIVRCSGATWRLARVEGKGWAFVPSRDLAKAPVTASDARHRVALELLETEESYGKALCLIKDVGGASPAPRARF